MLNVAQIGSETFGTAALYQSISFECAICADIESAFQTPELPFTASRHKTLPPLFSNSMCVLLAQPGVTGLRPLAPLPPCSASHPPPSVPPLLVS